MATINMGCINFSLSRLLKAFGFWKRKGLGSENTPAVIPLPSGFPPFLCGPAFYLLRAIKTNKESALTL
jgi:hypothetical protein